MGITLQGKQPNPKPHLLPFGRGEEGVLQCGGKGSHSQHSGSPECARKCDERAGPQRGDSGLWLEWSGRNRNRA